MEAQSEADLQKGQARSRRRRLRVWRRSQSGMCGLGFCGGVSGSAAGRASPTDRIGRDCAERGLSCDANWLLRLLRHQSRYLPGVGSVTMQPGV